MTHQVPTHLAMQRDHHDNYNQQASTKKRLRRLPPTSKPSLLRKASLPSLFSSSSAATSSSETSSLLDKMKPRLLRKTSVQSFFSSHSSSIEVDHNNSSNNSMVKPFPILTPLTTAPRPKLTRRTSVSSFFSNNSGDSRTSWHDDSIVLAGELDRIQPVTSTVTVQFQSQLKWERVRFLFGRQKECRLLQKQLLRPQNRQVIWIEGYTGVGKTALALSLRKNVEQMMRGLFAVGTCGESLRRRKSARYKMSDPLTTAISAPYASLHSALGRVLEDKESWVQQMQMEWEQEDWMLFQKVFADWLSSTGERLPCESERQEYQPHVMQGLYLRVLTFLARQVPIFVLVLDDLQWTDMETLQVIERSLLQQSDDTEGRIMFVGVSRSNQVDTDHDLFRLKQKVEQSAQNLSDSLLTTTLEVGDLSGSSVQDMVSELLALDDSQTLPLANVVHRKTNGNAFFVIQFLNDLVESEKLYYNVGLGHWMWNTEEIEATTGAANNVVDLMRSKLEESGVCAVAQVLACLGPSFPAAVITEILEPSQVSTDSCDPEAEDECPIIQRFREETDWLEKFVSVGFLEKCGCETYRFVHDSIQEAAIQTIPDDERDVFQYKLGLLLLNRLSEERLDAMLYVVTDLLNKRCEVKAKESSMAVRQAELNLRAGQKAMDDAAFITAHKFLHAGVAYLPENHWLEHKTLSLTLYTIAAKASLIGGFYSETNRLCADLLRQENVSLTEKVPAYSIRIESLTGVARCEDAIKLAMGVLEKLGCKFPGRGLETVTLGRELVKTKLLLRGKTKEDFLELPFAATEKSLVPDILYKLSNALYLCQNSNLLALTYLKLIQHALKDGLTEYTACAFAAYGYLLSGTMGDLKQGALYAKVSLELQCKHKMMTVPSRSWVVAHSYVLHWTTPLHLMEKEFLEGYHLSMCTGAILDAGMLLHQYLVCACNSGRALYLVDIDTRTAQKQMLDLHQSASRGALLVAWQYVENLLGPCSNPTLLDGKALDRERMVKDAANGDAIASLQVTHCKLYELRLCYYFGDLEKAYQLVHLCMRQEVEQTIAGKMTLLQTVLFSSLICFEKAHIDKDSTAKKLAKKLLGRIESWWEKGCPTCLHYVMLLKAERFALKLNKKQAISTYKTAIAVSARQGQIHDRALSNERLAHFFYRINDVGEARYHFEEACKLYGEWGAKSKQAHLQNEYLSLLE